MHLQNFPVLRAITAEVLLQIYSETFALKRSVQVVVNIEKISRKIIFGEKVSMRRCTLLRNISLVKFVQITLLEGKSEL